VATVTRAGLLEIGEASNGFPLLLLIGTKGPIVCVKVRGVRRRPETRARGPGDRDPQYRLARCGNDHHGTAAHRGTRRRRADDERAAAARWARAVGVHTLESGQTGIGTKNYERVLRALIDAEQECA